MKHLTKWLVVLLALAMVATACSQGDDGDATDDTEATETTEATTETTEATDDTEPTETTEATDDIDPMTDFGVDTDAKTITLGLLSDLTGPFGPLVSAITEGIRVYWEDVNANGGVNGYTVVLDVVDTVYVVDSHVQLYEEMRDDVAAIQHSTGSPHTVAILPQLAEDGMLTIPLTWYSGWSDPALNANLLSHGAPYCLESMNGISYIADDTGGTTLAIASVPGDYGLDGAAGAKLAAEALGLELVYDGAGAIIPTDETTLTAVANGISESGADIVWMTTTPSTMSAIFGQAIASGFDGVWGGNSPNWSPAFVAPDSPIKDAIAEKYYNSTYLTPWFAPEADDARELFRQYNADAPDLDYYLEGFVEAKIMHEALLKAFENGDLTRAGILAAGKSLESVDVGPFAPAEVYAGEPNDRVQRQTFIGRPDPEGLAAGTSAGWVLSEGFYTAPITEAFEFNEACYSLDG
jgi:ABC-type branched-subunit amino acid transport system substrate-binding protein